MLKIRSGRFSNNARLRISLCCNSAVRLRTWERETALTVTRKSITTPNPIIRLLNQAGRISTIALEADSPRYI